MTWRIVKAEVGVETDNANRGLDNSRYHTKTEFNNYFIFIRFIPTSYKFNYFDKMLELLYLIFQKSFPCCGRQHIIHRRDIITEYQELFVDAMS